MGLNGFWTRLIVERALKGLGSMRRLPLLFIAISFLVACSGQDLQRGQISQLNQSHQGIVGGQEIAPGSDASKIVVLVRGLYQETEKNDGFTKTVSHLEICTGAFITDDIVMTAAHCVFEAPYKLQIVYTTNSHDDSAPASEVESAVKNPDYVPVDSFTDTHMDDDIALIKIKGKKPADYQVLGLTQLNKISQKFNIISIGFGRTTGVEPTEQDPDQGVGQLRATGAVALSFDPTRNYFTIDQTNGHGVCQGDSGGPAVVNMDNQYYVIGVAKAVYREGEDLMNANADDDTCKYKAAYMNVQYYLPWITATVQSLDKK